LLLWKGNGVVGRRITVGREERLLTRPKSWCLIPSTGVSK
jgi:hypothetical protein